MTKIVIDIFFFNNLETHSLFKRRIYFLNIIIDVISIGHFSLPSSPSLPIKYCSQLENGERKSKYFQSKYFLSNLKLKTEIKTPRKTLRSLSNIDARVLKTVQIILLIHLWIQLKNKFFNRMH